MKKLLFVQILNILKADAQLRRKMKILAVAMLIVLIPLGGLVVWAGISAVNFAVSTVQGAIPPTIQTSALTKVQWLSCWGKAQSLFAIQPWIEKPVPELFKEMTIACLSSSDKTNQTPESEHHEKLKTAKEEVAI